MSKTTEQTPKKGGRRVKHTNDLVITVNAKENPKRKGSRCHGEFALYKNGMTVGQYLKAGGSRAGIRWDVDHGFISVAKAAAKAA